MPDWPRLIREHLPLLQLPPEDETAVVAELAQLCEDAFADHDHEDRSPTAAQRFLAEQATDLATLADEIRRSRNRPFGTMTTLTAPTPVRFRRTPMGLPFRLLQDARHAIRSLAGTPAITALAVLTIALGTGLNTAVFSLVNALLLRPASVSEIDSLVNIYTRQDDPESLFTHAPMSVPDVRDLAAEATTLSSVAAWSLTRFALERGDESESVVGELVSGTYFDTLGVPAHLGRTLLASDDRPGAAQPVAVLSHSTWRQRFDEDPAVVGRPVRINGQLLTVVGVAAPGFSGLIRGIASAVWVPLELSRSLNTTATANFGDATAGTHLLDDRGRRWVWVTARLSPGASATVAANELQSIAAGLRELHPMTNDERSFTLLPTRRVRLVPGGVDDALQAVSLGLQAIVLLVLLIASANVAGMLLARASGRRREMATRLSLGARRATLVRHLLVEGLVLAAAGASLGVGLAAVANHLFERLPLPLPVDIALGLAIDWRVLGFAAAASTLAALVFTLAPALSATRTDLATVLRDEGGALAAHRSGRLRSVLVVLQVALSLTLLVGAGLSLRSLLNAHRIDPGFNPDGAAVLTTSPDLVGLDAEQVAAYYERLGEGAAALPGVERVSFASHLPLTLEINSETVVEPGEDPDESGVAADGATVAPSYFAVMEIPFERGRDFAPSDLPDTPPVAIVNDTFAQRLWPGVDPVGRSFVIDPDRQVEVVGVVRTSRYRTLGEAPRPFFYLSMEQSPSRTRTLIARHTGEAAPVLSALGTLARQIDPRVPRVGLESLRQSIGSTLLLPRLCAISFGIFGLLGLALSAAGIYGVIAYAVAQRTREVGVRMALGAQAADILGLVVRQGLGLAAIGAVVGLLAALAASRSLSAILYGVSPTDALSFLAVTLFLGGIALLAAWVPARRAARLDPLVALRQD